MLTPRSQKPDLKELIMVSGLSPVYEQQNMVTWAQSTQFSVSGLTNTFDNYCTSVQGSWTGVQITGSCSTKKIWISILKAKIWHPNEFQFPNSFREIGIQTDANHSIPDETVTQPAFPSVTSMISFDERRIVTALAGEIAVRRFDIWYLKWKLLSRLCHGAILLRALGACSLVLSPGCRTFLLISFKDPGCRISQCISLLHGIWRGLIYW